MIKKLTVFLLVVLGIFLTFCKEDDPVMEPVLSKKTATLMVGDTLSLQVSLLSDNTKIVSASWGSSNEEVATVDQNGLIHAVSIGMADVTAMLENQNSASCRVEVVEKYVPVTSVEINEESIDMLIADTLTLTTTVLPEDANDKTVEWSSNNTDVATVTADGFITAIAVGEAIITAKSNDNMDVTGQCTIHVKPVAVTSVTLDKSDEKIQLSKGIQLTATVSPENAANKNISWSSGNEGIATVDETGYVTGIAAGTTEITVTTEDGNYTASCTVEVTEFKTLQPTYQWNFEDSSIEEAKSQLTSVMVPSDGTMNFVNADSDIKPAVGNGALDVSTSDKTRFYIDKLALAGDEGFSISFWFNIKELNRDQAVFFSQRIGGNGMMLMTYQEIKLRFQFWPSGGFTLIDAVESPVSKTGEWYNVVVELKSNEFVRIYVNGGLMSESTDGAIVSKYNSNPIGMMVGGHYDTNSTLGFKFGFNGYMDDIRVYKDIFLTEDQIKEIYEDRVGTNFYE